MTTSQDLKRVLQDALTLALSEKFIDNDRVIDLCNRLDKISTGVK